MSARWLVGPPSGNPAERPGWERPVRVKVGRGRPYAIGTAQGDTWQEAARSLSAVLRAAADDIDRQLEQEEQTR